MPGEVSLGRPQSARRTALAIGSAVVLLLALWMSVGPTTKAKADVKGYYQFCSNAWVQPYGQAGDRCASPLGGYLWMVQVSSYEHSACVSYLNNVGNVASSWACTPGPNNFATKYFVEDGVWRRGIVRNNTTNSGAHIAGKQDCITCG